MCSFCAALKPLKFLWKLSCHWDRAFGWTSQMQDTAVLAPRSILARRCLLHSPSAPPSVPAHGLLDGIATSHTTFVLTLACPPAFPSAAEGFSRFHHATGEGCTLVAGSWGEPIRRKCTPNRNWVNSPFPRWEPAMGQKSDMKGLPV